MDKKGRPNPCLLLLIISMLSSCGGRFQNYRCDKQDTLSYVSTQHGCVFIKVFKSDSISTHPNLIVVVHGDAPFNPPSYQYEFSQKLIEKGKNTIAVSVLRPGYKDNDGNKSDGNKGQTTGDNYTLEVINSLTTVIERLKVRFKPSKIVLVGHSGGATISADIVSINPNLIDKAILVSCPCNVEAFRKSMALKQPFYGAWRDSVKSISPSNLVNKLTSHNEITLIHGKEDNVVPVEIAKTYFEQLKRNNVKSKFFVLENAGHEIFTSTSVIAMVNKEITSE